jgi:hypothetical protein
LATQEEKWREDSVSATILEHEELMQRLKRQMDRPYRPYEE